MPNPSLTGRTVAVAILALLAGCSANVSQTVPGQALSTQPLSSQPLSSLHYRPMRTSNGAMSVLPDGFTPHTQRPAWMKAPPPGASKSHVAVAQFGASSVLWFPEKDKKNLPPAICEPASSTNGIRIDKKGNLWIPDGRANTVTEYAPNCGASELTIQDTTGEPADIAFDQQELVYVLNINDASGPPTIEVYNKRGKHVRTLGDPSFATLFGVGADGHGNVFASNQTSNNVGNVVEFPGGKMPGTALTGVALGLPGTPAFDRSDNLIISDWFQLTIDVFAPPYSSPPTTSPLRGSSIWCPLDHSEKHILCGDADFGSIDVYGYPGGAYQYSYTSGLSPSALVTGVAPAPPAPF